MRLPSFLIPEIHREAEARVQRLELGFNRFGLDPFGVSRAHLARFFTLLGAIYRHYLTVRPFGMAHIPARGRVMLVGNHSGGVALDGAMVLASLFYELEPPRLGHGMAEKFLNTLPFASEMTSRVGQFTGLPEHAVRLLEDERVLMVFPEGARGTAKLYRERHSLVRFGTGFMRLALATRTPIVPFAFLGGGEAIPTIMNLYTVGRMMGMPYLPVTPYLVPLPRPVPCEIYYGAPMVFDGDGDESDELIAARVLEVKERVGRLIALGVDRRRRDAIDEPLALDAGPLGEAS